jgi:DNA-binding response OmpR family regulator
MDATRILVVEDDRPVVDFISKGLEAVGFAVDSVR